MKTLSEILMMELYYKYIANYVDKKTRPYAHSYLLQGIEQYNDQIEQVDKEFLLSKTLKFSFEYSRAVFWKKRKVLISALKAI